MNDRYIDSANNLGSSSHLFQRPLRQTIRVPARTMPDIDTRQAQLMIWVGITYDNQIAQLPFGLILKWFDGTRVEEVLARQVARAAGFPVPKVNCYGEHPDTLILLS